MDDWKQEEREFQVADAAVWNKQVKLASFKSNELYLLHSTHTCFMAIWTLSKITWVSRYQNQSGFYWS